MLGIVLSAAIGTYAPPELLTGAAAYGVLAAMGVALALSLPLYVCATASVPIAASLVAAGLPLGAVIVFLMAGPATNAATVGAVYRGLGGRSLAVYLATIVVGSLAGGWLFEAWLGSDALPATALAGGHNHAHATGSWEAAAGVALLVWLAWCAARDGAGLVGYANKHSHAAH